MKFLRDFLAITTFLLAIALQIFIAALVLALINVSSPWWGLGFILIPFCIAVFISIIEWLMDWDV